MVRSEGILKIFSRSLDPSKHWCRLPSSHLPSSLPTLSDSAEPCTDTTIYLQALISRVCFSEKKKKKVLFSLVLMISPELHSTVPTLWLSSVLSGWKEWIERFQEKKKQFKWNKNLLKPLCCKILFIPHEDPNHLYIYIYIFLYLSTFL